MKAKILFQGLALFSLFLVGCASIYLKPGVQGKEFVSKYDPQLTVGVPDDWDYLGEMEKTRAGTTSDLVQAALTGSSQTYLFAKEAAGSRAERFLMISINRIREKGRAYYPRDYFTGVDEALASGRASIKGKTWHYAIFEVDRPLDEQEEDFMEEKGFIAPGPVRVLGLGRVSGSRQETKTYLLYAVEAGNRDLLGGNALTGSNDEEQRVQSIMKSFLADLNFGGQGVEFIPDSGE